MATNSEIELIRQYGTKCIRAKMVLADFFGLEKINTAEITIKVSEGEFDGLKLFRAVAGKSTARIWSLPPIWRRFWMENQRGNDLVRLGYARKPVSGDG